MSADTLPTGITTELEKLKRQLANMAATDITAEQTTRMAAEIGAIRLHLKRLAFDQQAAAARVQR